MEVLNHNDYMVKVDGTNTESKRTGNHLKKIAKAVKLYNNINIIPDAGTPSPYGNNNYSVPPPQKFQCQ